MNHSNRNKEVLISVCLSFELRDSGSSNVLAASSYHKLIPLCIPSHCPRSQQADINGRFWMHEGHVFMKHRVSVIS